MAVGEISAEEFLAGPGAAGLNLGVPPAEDDEISAEEFLAGPDGAGLGLDALPPEAPEAFVSTDPDPTTAPEIPTETAEISVEEFLAGPDGIGVAEKAEPDEEWRSQVTQAKTPREIVQWLDSLSPDERRIEGVDARALIMDWRRAGWLNELPDGDYEIDGAQLPKDYVHQAARDQVVDEFYNDYRGMRKVAMGTDNPAQAVQAIDDFLGKHRPDIANSLRNQNVAYLGWDKRGKAQWALDAMKSAEGMLNVVDATLGFIPRGVKTSVRNRATELRVAEGQIEISPSIRKSFERAIVRDNPKPPKPESSMVSLAALRGFDVTEDDEEEELEAVYPFRQWTIRAPVKGGGDPYQDTVIALDEAEAAEIITRRMADMGLEPKLFKTIKKDGRDFLRARIDAPPKGRGLGWLSLRSRSGSSRWTWTSQGQRERATRKPFRGRTSRTFVAALGSATTGACSRATRATRCRPLYFKTSVGLLCLARRATRPSYLPAKVPPRLQQEQNCPFRARVRLWNRGRSVLSSR